MVVLHAVARNELISGADVLARAVRTTLGPAGRSVILERTRAPPLATRDGAMAASLAPLGALQESGAALLRQAAARTKEEVRDGSTTATVPAHAMLRCAQAVQQLRNTASDELLHGLDTVIEALAAPFQQILANAGIEPKPVQGRVLGGTGAYGFDVAGQRYGDLQAFGVVDATVVTATALRNAASVATLLLSTDAVVSSEELL